MAAALERRGQPFVLATVVWRRARRRGSGVEGGGPARRNRAGLAGGACAEPARAREALAAMADGRRACSCSGRPTSSTARCGDGSRGADGLRERGGAGGVSRAELPPPRVVVVGRSPAVDDAWPALVRRSRAGGLADRPTTTRGHVARPHPDRRRSRRSSSPPRATTTRRPWRPRSPPTPATSGLVASSKRAEASSTTCATAGSPRTTWPGCGHRRASTSGRSTTDEIARGGARRAGRADRRRASCACRSVRRRHRPARRSTPCAA